MRTAEKGYRDKICRTKKDILELVEQLDRYKFADLAEFLESFTNIETTLALFFSQLEK